MGFMIGSIYRRHNKVKCSRMLFIAKNECALLSRETSKKDAQEYYYKKVAGTVIDSRGNPIEIRPTESNFLFAKKNIKSGSLKIERVRRLPWIRPVLTQSKIIRVEKRHGENRELFLAEVGVFIPILGKWTPSPFGFCVVVGGLKAKKRFFITSYPIGNHDFYASKLALPEVY